MKQQKFGHKNRVRNLVIALTLTAVILSVSTYAWFIGLQTVNVTDFDVEIAVTEDLELSLDGETFSSSVTINSTNFNTDAYDGNTNWWAGETVDGGGLVPMSTVGDIDPDSSRMVLFEKASITTSLGGFRLMASRVESTIEGNDEKDGYVVFDLFIKNSSGAAYFENYDPLDEEAIFLSTDSAVVVNSSGAGIEDTGIENSVRLAFAQIGRTKADADVSLITGISCEEGVTGVTPICQRRAQIWEPNDADHVPGALSWYQTSCKPRIGTDLNDAESFDDGLCEEVTGTVPTYAVNRVIASSDAVDVYDGTAYNGYTTTVDSKEVEEPEKPLYEFPYFTDTMKNQTGTARPQFMTLSPNSITKVRVYIYIEGQDVDNYDFASIGKSVLINFGFTKQRYIQGDIPGYDGPEITSRTTTTTQP